MERKVKIDFIGNMIRFMFAVRGDVGGLSVDMILSDSELNPGEVQFHRAIEGDGSEDCWMTNNRLCEFDSYGVEAAMYVSAFIEIGSDGIYAMLERDYKMIVDREAQNA